MDQTATLQVTVTVDDGRGADASSNFLVHLQPRMVTTSGDSGEGSLRQVLTESAPGDVIAFAADIRGTIVVTSELVLDRSITIEGPGRDLLALGDGRGSRVLNVGAVTAVIEGITITEGSADTGGAILNLGSLTLIDTAVTKSVATGNGGGIFNDGGSLRLEGSRVSENTAGGWGGGIYVDGGSVEMVADSELSLNGTSGYAGGMYLSDDAEATIENSAFPSNSASAGFGGGIYSNGTLTIIDSLFDDNIALGRGGAIHSSFGGFTLRDSTISNNETWDELAGGLYLSGIDATIENTVFEANEAQTNGGGIFAHQATLVITGGRISNNRAQSNGGGVFIGESEVTLTDVLIEGNIATNEGGGVYTTSGSTPSTVTIVGGSISDNAATDPDRGAGGGLSTRATVLTIDGTDISGNTAVNGGAINNATNIYGGAETTIRNATIRDNRADRHGGAIYSDQPEASVELFDSIIAGNHADENGGAIYIDRGSVVTLHSGVIGGDTNADTNDAAFGGGIYIDGSHFNVVGTPEITGNHASDSGGGIFLLTGSYSGAPNGVLHDNTPDDIAFQ